MATGRSKSDIGEHATKGGNKRDFGEHATKGGNKHVNGPGTRCSLFSRIFSTFPETTLLASAFGWLRESHPLSLHPRARFSFKKKKLY